MTGGGETEADLGDLASELGRVATQEWTTLSARISGTYSETKTYFC